MPVVEIVAAAVLLLLQLPVTEVSVSVMVFPTHKPEAPEIGLPATGRGLTVIFFVAIAEEPQVLVTV
jgi:hypothetical protein